MPTEDIGPCECCGSGNVPCDCSTVDPVVTPTLTGTMQVIDPTKCNGLPDATFDMVYTPGFGGHAGWLATGGFYDGFYLLACEGSTWRLYDFTEQTCLDVAHPTLEDCSDGLYLEFENISDIDDPDLGQCCFGGGGLRLIVTSP